MKRILSFFLSALLVLSLFPLCPSAQAKGKVSLSGETENKARGDYVTFVLELNRNPGVDSLLVTLRFDPAKLEFVSLQDLELLPQFDSSLHEEGGEVVLRWSTTEDRGILTDTGRLAECVFRVRNDALLTDTTVEPVVDERYFDAVDDKGNPVPFDCEGLKVSLPCYHVNTKKDVTKEATFAENGAAQVVCLDCNDTWEETLLSTLVSEDGKTVGEVQAGEYSEEDEKILRTDFLYGGAGYEKATALFQDNIIRVFQVSFIKNETVFTPKGKTPLRLTVDFDLPESFYLYCIQKDSAEKADFQWKDGVLSFDHQNGIFVLVSREVSVPPVTDAPPSSPTTVTDPPTSALSPEEKTRRREIVYIAAGIAGVVLFGTGAILVLRKRERF